MSEMRKHIFFTMLLLYCTQLNATDNIIIGNFSNNELKEWESHSFEGETQYNLVTDAGISVLKAQSKQAASGMIKKQRIDIKKTPYLNWRWKVDNALFRLSETFKEGDDFAARIYIIIDGGVFFWRTVALNYVWASGQPKGSAWRNPFTSNAAMIALQSGDKHKQEWVHEKRNVYQDLKQTFGKEFRFIDAVAIMTDTDNSGQKATAYYGDLFFSTD